MEGSKRVFKGVRQIQGFNENFNINSLEEGYLYFVRTNPDSLNEGFIYLNGRCYGTPSDLSNLVTDEEFEPISTAALNAIAKGTLGKINDQSLEDGDITLDMSLYKIVSALPTEHILDNKIYLVKDETSENFNKWIYIPEESRWEMIGRLTDEIDLSGYLKTADADKKYIAKSTNQNTSIVVSNTGAMSNYSDNGQAYLAIRPRTSRFLINAPYAGAAFGVKDDGASAFSHKTYATYNVKTGAYTGAKNTAILQFSGPLGFRYAKNTSSSTDVTEDMYRYVGVIDSPDEFQRVYSAKQVDDLLKAYDDEIAALKQAIRDLGGTI